MNDVPRHNNRGARGIRTPDLLIANETRYQLRHSPKCENQPSTTSPKPLIQRRRGLTRCNAPMRVAFTGHYCARRNSRMSSRSNAVSAISAASSDVIASSERGFATTGRSGLTVWVSDLFSSELSAEATPSPLFSRTLGSTTTRLRGALAARA